MHVRYYLCYMTCFDLYISSGVMGVAAALGDKVVTVPSKSGSKRESVSPSPTLDSISVSPSDTPMTYCGISE
jgi:hypothetical protein